ncbi:hypothetical protein GCM10008931_39020 [Oceanobacillus oncorhynchi subsp. oncorhynchi]
MDYVTFLKDIYHHDGDLTFRKNFDYRLLGEDDNYYYISPFESGNECSQFPKRVRDEVFEIL